MKHLKRVLALLLALFLLVLAYFFIRTDIRADVLGGVPVRVLVHDEVGVPLPQDTNVRMTLVSARGTAVTTAKRETSGHYVLTAPGTGNYTLEITADGFAKETRPLILSDQSPVEQIIFLRQQN